MWIADLATDLRGAVRSLRRHKLLSGVVMATLALAIGANTALFSLMDGLLLRDLPVRDPQHLYLLRWQARSWPQYDSGVDYGDCNPDYGIGPALGCDYSYDFYDRVSRHARGLSEVAAYGGLQAFNLTGYGAATELHAEPVSGGYFATLGLRPAAGRLLVAADDQSSAPVAVVLSYRFWHEHFGGDPGAIGRTVKLTRVPATIVGVAPRGFGGLSPGSNLDGWVALHAMPRISVWWDNGEWGPGAAWLVVVGRVRPGTSVGAAEAEVGGLFRSAMLDGTKKWFRPAAEPEIRLVPSQSAMQGARAQYTPPLLALLWVAGAILLLACANIAGLLLGRAHARQREFAVRRALGAASGRILRQLLAESLVLAGAGGLLGLGLAAGGSRALTAAIMSAHTGLRLDAPLDGTVLLFALATTVATGVVFGLAPAFRGMRGGLVAGLKAAGGTTPRNRGRMGDALVVGQVAVCAVVLAGAGLLARTYANARAIAPGIDAENLLEFDVAPAFAGYSGARSTRLMEQLQAGIAALPGVRAASYAEFAPIGGGMAAGSFEIGGGAKPRHGDADMQGVGPGYFAAVGQRVLLGRAFDEQDFAAAGGSAKAAMPAPVVVNQLFVRQYLTGNPVGQMLGPKLVVVGVVSDARYAILERPVPPMVYEPLSEGAATFLVRTAGNPLLLQGAARRVLAGLDPNLPMTRTTTLEHNIDRQLFQQRMLAELAETAAGLALLLAALGLYALLAQEVGRRTREIGIRMALGADRRRMLGGVLARGAGLAGAGLVVGCGAALLLTRYLKSLLFGVQPADPATLAATGGVLLLLALAACLVPARRAAAVDPQAALREE